MYSIVDGDLVARLDDHDGHPKSRAALVKRLAEELDALAKLKLRKGNAKRLGHDRWWRRDLLFDEAFPLVHSPTPAPDRSSSVLLASPQRTKDWVRVEWLSEKIKAKTKEVASLRRMTMPAQLWCPFCLWEPPF